MSTIYDNPTGNRKFGYEGPRRRRVDDADGHKEHSRVKAEAQGYARKIVMNFLARYDCDNICEYSEEERYELLEIIKDEVEGELTKLYVNENGITKKELELILDSVTLKMVEHFLKRKNNMSKGNGNAEEEPER